jgi:Tfp pilus assembly protein PilV
MITLLLLTMMVISTFTIGKGSLKIVTNTRDRNQAANAAQQTLGETVNSSQFNSNPAQALTTTCNGTANSKCIDVDGDGNNDVSVTVTSNCKASQPIPNSALDPSDPESQKCLLGAGQTGGIEGTISSNSSCSNQVWDVKAAATDLKSGAQYTAAQGVAVRTSAVCP